MDGQLYKKVGRKYVPIGYSDNFNGFPSEGLWVVYNKSGVKSYSCIAQAGQFQPIDYSLPHIGSESPLISFAVGGM